MSNNGKISENLVPTFQGKSSHHGGNLGKEVPTRVNSLQNNKLAGNEVWITSEQGGNLLSISKRAVNKNIKAGKYTVKMADTNGGKGYLIALSSLPEHAQLKYKKEHIKEEITTELSIHNSFEKPIKTDLNEKQNRIALTKYDVLILFKENRRKYRGKKAEADELFCKRFNNLREWPDLYNTLGKDISRQSLYRWDKTLRQNNDDYRSLAENYNYNKKPIGWSPDQAKIILSYFLHPNRLKIADVIKLSKVKFTESDIECDVSNSTIERWIKRWERENYDKCVLHREGQSALNDKVLPYLERDKSLTEVGDMIVLDGKVLDFEIINPATGKPKRMIVIGVLDYHSDILLGWSIMPTENTQNIAEAVRRAIKRLGFKPRVINIDNGRAFQSKWFMGNLESSGVQGLFKTIAEHVLVSRPYHGQSKTIERFFQVFATLERRLSTFVGSGISDKPARLLRNEKLHSAIYNRYLNNFQMSIAGAHFVIQDWLEEYIQTPHKDGQHKGLKPHDIFINSIKRVEQQPDFNNRIISDKKLEFLMMTQEVKTLYRNGIRLFRDQYYWNEKFYSMKKEKGNVDFVIRYDIENLNSILVYDKETGEFICEASHRDRVHPIAEYTGTDDDASLVKNLLKEQRTLEKTTQQDFKNFYAAEAPVNMDKITEVLEEKEEKRIEKNVKNAKSKLKPKKKKEANVTKVNFDIDFELREKITPDLSVSTDFDSENDKPNLNLAVGE